MVDRLEAYPTVEPLWPRYWSRNRNRRRHDDTRRWSRSVERLPQASNLGAELIVLRLQPIDDFCRRGIFRGESISQTIDFSLQLLDKFRATRFAKMVLGLLEMLDAADDCLAAQLIDIRGIGCRTRTGLRFRGGSEATFRAIGTFRGVHSHADRFFDLGGFRFSIAGAESLRLIAHHLHFNARAIRLLPGIFGRFRLDLACCRFFPFRTHLRDHPLIFSHASAEPLFRIQPASGDGTGGLQRSELSFDFLQLLPQLLLMRFEHFARDGILRRFTAGGDGRRGSVGMFQNCFGLFQ